MMQIKLPDQIHSSLDLDKLVAALNAKTVDASAKDLLDAFWETNPKLSADQKHRPSLVEQMERIAKQAQKVSCSFAQPPDTEFLTDLISWLRSNVKPYLVLEVELDPLLVGGMVLRTNEHIYDWSWQQKLNTSKPKLVGLIHAS